MAGAAEEPVVGDPELLHRVGQLGDPVLAERVVLVGGQVRQVGDEHLALLAEGAGHQRDLGARGRRSFAIVAPWPIVSSSGWACTSSSRWSMRAMLGRRGSGP